MVPSAPDLGYVTTSPQGPVGSNSWNGYQQNGNALTNLWINGKFWKYCAIWWQNF